MTRFEDNRKNVEQWINLYQNIINNANNVCAVLYHFDGRQFNKKLSDALYNAISDKKEVKLFCNYDANHFDLEFKQGMGGNYHYMAKFSSTILLNNRSWQRQVGKTPRLNADVVIEKFNKDIEDLKNHIVELQEALTTIDNLIAEHNEIIKQQNAKIRALPFEIRDAYRREFDKVMYL